MWFVRNLHHSPCFSEIVIRVTFIKHVIRLLLSLLYILERPGLGVERLLIYMLHSSYFSAVWIRQNITFVGWFLLAKSQVVKSIYKIPLGYCLTPFIINTLTKENILGDEKRRDLELYGESNVFRSG